MAERGSDAAALPGSPAARNPFPDYRAPPGAWDEMLASDGSVRPAWRDLTRVLGRQTPAELAQRFARADQYLADAGVYYRLYTPSGAPEREWPLSHVPLVLDADEWQAISAGLVQRATLLEALCADLYGDNRLVSEGLLPAELVAGNPEWLRPMVGHPPASGHFLHFLAFELGRAPDGRWWVLGDRAQAPSGAGFALENRVATSRALGDLYGSMNVHRLAGFFRDFRDHLFRLRRQGGDAVAILTSGPLNETYFEHAYIARYLGFLLLEGEDLAVVDGQLTVRTVSGLKPVSVLWRRLDAAFADPLELNPDSRIGTPGLAHALRQGAATSVNALGSGILETRALLAFLPRLAPRLLGAPLALPNIATWWCGGDTERKHVVQNLHRMMIGPALSTRLPFEDDDTRAGAELDPAALDRLRAEIASNGAAFVAQEAVSLSTVPVDIDGRLAPRPLVLRAFAARTDRGWTVMPGGFARIGASSDLPAIAMQRGGSVADVWIRSQAPVAQTTLIALKQGGIARSPQGFLPARAADNLFWLGRYVERAEFLLRILRAWHGRLAEAPDGGSALLDFSARYLEGLGACTAEPVPAEVGRTIEDVAGTAARIRDRFSPDGWLALSDLSATLRKFGAVQPGSDAAGAMTVLLRKLAGFSGLVHENMYRFTGWRFLEIGRRLERAMQTTRLLRDFAGDGAPEGALDMLLEIGDSVLTHRRRYAMSFRAETHLDLLALDPSNPRSILFQLAEIKAQVAHLPPREGDGHRALESEVLRLHDQLAGLDPGGAEAALSDGLLDALAGLSDLLSQTYLR